MAGFCGVETELRGRLDEYLTRRGLPLKRAFNCLSPDHEDRHPSMSFNRKANNVHCFSCGITYDIFDLVGHDYGLSGFREKVNKTAEIFDVSFGVQAYPEKSNQRFRGYSIPSEELEGKRTGSLDYFEFRGISQKTCAKYGLFQTTVRAYFPVFQNGSVVGYSARALEEDTSPRYKNSSGAMPVWNEDLLKTTSPEGGRCIFITEGIVDALSLEELGYDSVALCGSQNGAKLAVLLEVLPEEHRNKLRFVLCGDNDEAGRKMNKTLSQQLDSLNLKSCDFWENFGISDFVDINEIYLRDPKRLELTLEEVFLPPAYGLKSAARRLDSFFSDIAALGDGVETGFLRLDKLLDGGLYPGLYVLGSISSLGKTSFALQIADNISASGYDVLYISLEQSISELVGKSLSRLSASTSSPLSLRDVLMGRGRLDIIKRSALDIACEEYSQISTNLYPVESIGDIGASDLRRLVKEHSDAKGKAPVLFVDYLQILKPEDSRATDKQSIDRSVVELKRISRDFNIPVVAISSFNRENYKAAVSMEAFKESGAVEYSADVLLGLQLQGVGESGFDLNKAKLQSPRKLELVLLKNRSGLPYAKLPLLYDAKYSLFEEPSRLIAMGKH